MNKKKRVFLGTLVLVPFSLVSLNIVACDNLTVEETKDKENEKLSPYEERLNDVKKVLTRIQNTSLNQYELKFAEFDEPKDSGKNVVEKLKSAGIRIDEETQKIISNLPEDIKIQTSKRKHSESIKFLLSVYDEENKVSYSKEVYTTIKNTASIPYEYDGVNGRFAIAQRLVEKYVNRSEWADRSFINTVDVVLDDEIHLKEASNKTKHDGEPNFWLKIDPLFTEFCKKYKIKIKLTKSKGSSGITWRLFSEDLTKQSFPFSVDTLGRYHDSRDYFEEINLQNGFPSWTVVVNGKNIIVPTVTSLATIDEYGKTIYLGHSTNGLLDIYKTDGTRYRNWPKAKLLVTGGVHGTTSSLVLGRNNFLYVGPGDSINLWNFETFGYKNKTITSAFPKAEKRMLFPDYQNGFYEFHWESHRIMHYLEAADKVIGPFSFELANEKNIRIVQVLKGKVPEDGYIVPAWVISLDGSKITSRIYRVNKELQLVSEGLEWNIPELDWKVTYVQKDNKGFYWVVGLSGEIALLNPAGQVLEEQKKLISDRAISIQPDSNNGVFVSYKSGHIRHFINDNNQIKQIDDQWVFSKWGALFKDRFGYFYLIYSDQSGQKKQNHWMRLDKQLRDTYWKINDNEGHAANK